MGRRSGNQFGNQQDISRKPEEDGRDYVLVTLHMVLGYTHEGGDRGSEF